MIISVVVHSEASQVVLPSLNTVGPGWEERR